MSYILDALKKIEHEKNRKRPDGRVSISGDLFQERQKPAARGGAWKIVAVITLVALLTSAGTWFALRGDSKKRPVTARQVVPPPVAPSPVAPAPAAAPTIPVPPAPPAPVVVAPAAPSPAPPAVPETSKVQKSSPAPASSPRSVRPAKKRSTVPAPAPASIQPVQVAPVVPAPADIKLSGIAWQDERPGRRAVINGYLLKEGAAVSGTTITEILADRVRFTSPAGRFEIKLDSVLPAEAPR